MTSRLLPREEWPKLAGSEAETVWPLANPENARVVVVEDDGRIVATWMVLRMTHVECLWIDPGYRGRFSILRRLWKGVRAVAREWGSRTVLTAAMSDDVRSLIALAQGQQLPGDHYVIPLEEICPQP